MSVSAAPSDTLKGVRGLRGPIVSVLSVAGFLLAWFIAAEGLLLYFIIRYRRRKNTPAAYVRGASLRQLSWILVPAVLPYAFRLVAWAMGNPKYAARKQTVTDGSFSGIAQRSA